MPLISGGGRSFNGGTITAGLDINPADTGQSALAAVMPAGSFANPLDVETVGVDQTLRYTSDGSLVVLDPSDASALNIRGAAVGANNIANFRLPNNSVAVGITATGGVLMLALPSADPHVVGALYTVVGTLHVSAG